MVIPPHNTSPRYCPILFWVEEPLSLERLCVSGPAFRWTGVNPGVTRLITRSLSQNLRKCRMVRQIFTVAMLAFASANSALAGGPKYVAGSTYFNASSMGQPITWPLGAINYYN